MKKSEKKEQIEKMIADFFKMTEPASLTEMRNKIYKEILKLPMSLSDKNTLENEMYLWNYNCDAYIKNIKSNTFKTVVASDFKAMLKKINISLLGN
ncbi:hypothetical protein [Flavobacterium beibuense]|uniref:Uncharacterized protein n=1 Tax=Flavobacterium beibuense F44-8 TaxID=1406840 RepID=A0A0A2LIX0_9FLAO|nr:hypothetical protein [Flavobacterium beibuense]KGO79869.1 hypothetical protein Q763_11725 [Flavobacterium beibuense F44-8]